MFSVVLTLAILMSLLMAGAWALQRATGSSGWIDTVWAGSVGLGGIFAVVFAGGDGWRRGATLFLVVVWSLRLAGHIGMRIARRRGRSPLCKAYEAMGSAAALRLFIFLQIQAIAAFVLVLAVYLAASNTHVFPRMVDVIAMVVALGALAGEALSDAQLWKFSKTAAAKTVSAKPGCGVIPAIPTIFRMAFLVRFSAAGHSGAGLVMGIARRTGDDVLAACPCLRHSAA